MVAYFVSVVADRELRHARLLASDELRSQSGLSNSKAEAASAHLRSLFATRPGDGIDQLLVRLDPFTKAAIRLEPVLDDAFE